MLSWSPVIYRTPFVQIAPTSSRQPAKLFASAASQFDRAVADAATDSPRTMRGHGRDGRARGSRRRVFTCPNIVHRRFACGAVGGAIFGNQFQSRSFVGTSCDAYPISVHDPLMANFLDCIFCHCGPTTVRPQPDWHLRLTSLTVLLTYKRKPSPLEGLVELLLRREAGSRRRVNFLIPLRS